jgi:hypothetical protein
MNTLKKLLPSLLAIGGVALTAFTPAIQTGLAGFVTAHPSIAATIAGAFGIFAHLWPQPKV